MMKDLVREECQSDVPHKDDQAVGPQMPSKIDQDSGEVAREERVGTANAHRRVGESVSHDWTA